MSLEDLDDTEALKAFEAEHPTEKVDSSHKLRLHANAHHLWGLGIVIVIGGQYFSWNVGLSAGYGSYIIGTALVGYAYLTLCMCLAEMSSCLPFAGGSYAYTRATLGKRWGYVVGCTESLEYVVYVSVTALVFGQMVSFSTNLSSQWEPVWWLLFYVLSLIIQIRGGKFFWTFNFVFAVFITSVLVFYWFATIPYMNFNLYAAIPDTNGMDQWFAGGISGFLTALPLTIWLYIGVEATVLAAEETHKPKITVSKGILSTIITLCITAIITVTVVCANPTGVLDAAANPFPLNPGLSKIFRITDDNSYLMTIWSIPATFATGFGFIFAYGRQIFAMARSGLFPHFLSLTYKNRGTPHYAMIAGSVIGYFICLLGFFATDTLVFSNILFELYLMGAIITYIFQLISFIVLRVRFPALTRQYRNPMGLFGALSSGIIFLLCLVSILGFQQYIWQPIAGFLGWLFLCFLYYMCFARYQMKMSPEEQYVMFMVFTVKFRQTRDFAINRRVEKKIEPQRLEGELDSQVYKIRSQQQIKSIPSAWFDNNDGSPTLFQLKTVNRNGNNNNKNNNNNNIKSLNGNELISLDTLLRNEICLELFKATCQASLSLENLQFYSAVQGYRELLYYANTGLIQNINSAEILGQSIVTNYIKENSQFQVNISGIQRKQIRDHITTYGYTTDLFNVVQKEIFSLLLANNYKPFLETEQYQLCVEIINLEKKLISSHNNHNHNHNNNNTNMTSNNSNDNTTSNNPIGSSSREIKSINHAMNHTRSNTTKVSDKKNNKDTNNNNTKGTDFVIELPNTVTSESDELSCVDA